LCGVLGVDWKEKETKQGEEGGQGQPYAGEGGHGDEDSWWHEPDGEEYSVVRAAVCKRRECSVLVVEL